MRRWGLTLVVALCLTSLEVRADVDLQAVVPVLLKVLTYDVNFDARGAGPFNVLVVTPAGRGASYLDALKKVQVTKVKNRPVSYVACEYKDDASFQTEIDHAKASAVMVTPGVPMSQVKALWEVAQDNQLYALALDSAMVEQALPVGVTMAGDKPQIIINDKSSKAVGVRFETSVLRLARVIQ